MFDETLDWDTNDMLLVQPKPEIHWKKHGYYRVTSNKTDLIRILVKLEDDGSDGEKARRHARSKKGPSIRKKQSLLLKPPMVKK